MRWHRLLSLLITAECVIGQADGQTASPVTNALTAGNVGSLHIGMKQREVEALLRRNLDLDEFLQFPTVTDLKPGDLQSLGIDQIAGIHTTGADLQFDSPQGGDHHLYLASIAFSCNDLVELEQRLDYANASTTPLVYEPRPTPYAWGIIATPGCYLWLRLATDKIN